MPSPKKNTKSSPKKVITSSTRKLNGLKFAGKIAALSVLGYGITKGLPALYSKTKESLNQRHIECKKSTTEKIKLIETLLNLHAFDPRNKNLFKNATDYQLCDLLVELLKNEKNREDHINKPRTFKDQYTKEQFEIIANGKYNFEKNNIHLAWQIKNNFV
jgi:hypothetical protein